VPLEIVSTNNHMHDSLALVEAREAAPAISEKTEVALGGTVMVPECRVYSTPPTFRSWVRPSQSTIGTVNRCSLQSQSILAPTTNFGFPAKFNAALLAPSYDMIV
jgi:hypothetical protein